MSQYRPGERTPCGAIVLGVFAVTAAGRVFYMVILPSGRRGVLPEDELGQRKIG